MNNTIVTSQFRTQVCILNPDQAQQLLTDHNHHNRTINDNAVGRYRRGMTNGRWIFDGAPIRFSKTGVLLDGQHRLTALAQCPPDTRIRFLLQFGLDDNAQRVMDQGRKRSSASQLYLSGIKDSVIVSAGIRLYIEAAGIMFDGGERLHRRDITVPQIADWAEQHHDVIDAINPTIAVIKRTEMKPSVAYASAILFLTESSPEACWNFFDQLANGLRDGQTSPINALDQRLRALRRTKQHVNQIDEIGLVIRAWNAWRGGKQMRQIQLPNGGHFTTKTFPKQVAA